MHFARNQHMQPQATWEITPAFADKGGRGVFLRLGTVNENA